MDPVSMIVTALAAGAAAATKDTVSQVVKDAYAGLKALIQSRFANKPQAELALAEFEKDPDTWEKPLEKSLVAAGVDADAAIIEHAQRVLQLVQPQQYSQGKYNVQVTGNVQGQIIGDKAHQENVFGDGSSKS
jgi:hypothetical protein